MHILKREFFFHKLFFYGVLIQAAVESDSDKASALEERAALYWKAALPLLDNVARNETITNTPKTIFEYHGFVIEDFYRNAMLQ